jgi:hypothetical protein
MFEGLTRRFFFFGEEKTTDSERIVATLCTFRPRSRWG